MWYHRMWSSTGSSNCGTKQIVTSLHYSLLAGGMAGMPDVRCFAARLARCGLSCFFVSLGRRPWTLMSRDLHASTVRLVHGGIICCAQETREDLSRRLRYSWIGGRTRRSELK